MKINSSDSFVASFIWLSLLFDVTLWVSSQFLNLNKFIF